MELQARQEGLTAGGVKTKQPPPDQWRDSKHFCSTGAGGSLEQAGPNNRPSKPSNLGSHATLTLTQMLSNSRRGREQSSDGQLAHEVTQTCTQGS